MLQRACSTSSPQRVCPVADKVLVQPGQTVRRSESALWRRSLSSLNGIAKLPCFSRHARAAARS